MKIKADIYRKLISETPVPPPETGGILGRQADVVTQYFPDCGNSPFPAHYRPDVMKLNRVIAGWQAEEIAFCGIYHSHYPCDTALSEEDCLYIRKIMGAMPQDICALHFPLVLPKERLIGYLASKEANTVRIACEMIEII